MDNIVRDVQDMPQRKGPLRNAAKEPGDDRWVQKTRRLLHEAMASLVHEKSYDDIVVKEILGRANVGRSTFYTHFAGKEELLESAIRDVVHSVPPLLPARAVVQDAIIAFSLPILEYIDQRRRLCGVRTQGKAFGAFHEQRLQPALAELIAAELQRACRSRPNASEPVPPELLVEHIAATFVLVLNWWIGSGSALGPQEVNEVFRALVAPTLAALFTPVPRTLG